MTAHELARKLLEGPDVPVVIDGHVGWGEPVVPVDATDVREQQVARIEYSQSISGEWRYDLPSLPSDLGTSKRLVVRIR